jgi:anti-sigma B factor antagonist
VLKQEINVKIESRIKNNIGILTINGKFTSRTDASELKQHFLESAGLTKNFVFDLSELEFINSIGLNGITACLKHAVDNGGNIKVCNLQAKPKMVFEITRVCHLIDTFDSLDMAVKSFSEGNDLVRNIGFKMPERQLFREIRRKNMSGTIQMVLVF